MDLHCTARIAESLSLSFFLSHRLSSNLIIAEASEREMQISSISHNTAGALVAVVVVVVSLDRVSSLLPEVSLIAHSEFSA